MQIIKNQIYRLIKISNIYNKTDHGYEIQLIMKWDL